MENAGNIFTQLLPLVVLIAIFYFLIIRPQQKQAKNHREKSVKQKPSSLKRSIKLTHL